MFSKLTMKMRLMLVVVPLILVLASLGLLGLSGLKSSNQALFNVYEDGMVDFSHIAMIDQLMARARGDASRPLFDEEDESFAESADKLTQKMAAIRQEHHSKSKTTGDPLAELRETSVLFQSLQAEPFETVARIVNDDALREMDAKRKAALADLIQAFTESIGGAAALRRRR